MSNDINSLDNIIPGLSSELKEQFVAYFTIIEKFNNKINLISKSTVKRAGVKHFADSYFGLKLFQQMLPDNQPVFDFGSGNGFPGIVFAMMESKRNVILIERDQRKAEFLKTAANEMKLSHVEVHAGSLSDLEDGTCKIGISRAMAPMPKFLLETRNIVAPGGSVYLFKGDHWMTEFGSCPAPIFDFWEVNLLGQYELPDDVTGDRFIVQCNRL